MHVHKGALRGSVVLAFVLAIVVLLIGVQEFVQEKSSSSAHFSAAASSTTQGTAEEPSLSAVATINPSSLITSLQNPTVSGTALGDMKFGLNVTDGNDLRIYSGPLVVKNGEWSVKIPTALVPGTYTVHIYGTPPSGDTTHNVALAQGSLVVRKNTTLKTVSGVFEYDRERSLPGRFYVGAEQNEIEGKEPFIVFPNEQETLQLFGIDSSASRSEGCTWVVTATIQISDRRTATIDGLAADVAYLVSVSGKSEPQNVCGNN